jgi:hypothetical protein
MLSNYDDDGDKQAYLSSLPGGLGVVYEELYLNRKTSSGAGNVKVPNERNTPPVDLHAVCYVDNDNGDNKEKQIQGIEETNLGASHLMVWLKKGKKGKFDSQYVQE